MYFASNLILMFVNKIQYFQENECKVFATTSVGGNISLFRFICLYIDMNSIILITVNDSISSKPANASYPSKQSIQHRWIYECLLKLIRQQGNVNVAFYFEKFGFNHPNPPSEL